MESSGAGSVAFGLLFMAAGSALLVLSLEQHERVVNGIAARTAVSCPPATAAPCPACPTCAPVASATHAAPTQSTTAAASASASASAATSASAPSDALTAAFAFTPNDIVMPKDELDRLKAYGIKLRSNPRVKFTIDAYGDAGSPEDKAKSLGKRRAAIVREVFIAIGIGSERILPPTADEPSPGKAIIKLQAPLEVNP